MLPSNFLGSDLPLVHVQLPWAGVRDSAMAIAVSNAGGAGSLPCAMLKPAMSGQEWTAIKSQTAEPYKVEFFATSKQDLPMRIKWRGVLHLRPMTSNRKLIFSQCRPLSLQPGVCAWQKQESDNSFIGNDGSGGHLAKAPVRRKWGAAICRHYGRDRMSQGARKFLRRS